ncbi:hypothetical protein [Alkalicoccobacillus plakortidis]|uniref:SAF domain-containing protein n=1 Tax=Alkalicoccobacillus plakortidis TaxID=444060 RepID=A0ABT0XKU8_9BACI|nr:hypothetical protein [Alkalicoccobacillus plakortidis]MCM2675837.1 hypothetical protein [Alkalicoccobacillus plakortidis]
MKTIRRVSQGGDILLNNGLSPKIGVAAVTKRNLKPEELIKKGIGSFQVRGEAIRLSEEPNHIPIGLLRDAVVKRPIEPGQILTFDDVEIEESTALRAWRASCAEATI